MIMQIKYSPTAYVLMIGNICSEHLFTALVLFPGILKHLKDNMIIY